MTFKVGDLVKRDDTFASSFSKNIWRDSVNPFDPEDVFIVVGVDRFKNIWIKRRDGSSIKLSPFYWDPFNFKIFHDREIIRFTKELK